MTVGQVGSTRLLGRLLTIAGVIEIAVGLLHFAMPAFYHRSPALADLPDQDDDFIALVTFAVGILLIAFGATTLLFARRPHLHLDLLVPFLIIKTVLWTARLLLEIVYPVRLSMFGINPFTVIVTPGVAAELAIFAIAAHLAHRSRRVESRPAIDKSCRDRL